MSSVLTGATIAVIGGDDREIVMVPELIRMGADVRVAGISKLSVYKKVRCFDRIEDAVQDARFIILPMPGIDEKGIVRAKYGAQPLLLNKDVMMSFRDDSVLITGVARPLLKQLAAQRGLKLLEIADNDEVVILNSVPSAEGAIQMAMEATDITIHGSTVIVIGFGRCGITLVRMLMGLGAKTSVVARKPRDLARIREMGLLPVSYDEFPDSLRQADIVFNTVPSLVLTRDLLSRAKPSVYICDIASAPGGVDFAAAGELGLNAVLAPGLPGKVAPRTAGLILAKVIPDLILTELNSSSYPVNMDQGSRGCLDAT